jgi:hypothetical protein
VAESLQGQTAAQLLADRTGRQGRQEGRVLLGTGQHRHIGMVLGGGAHHRRAADIDVLDRHLPGHIRARDGFAEGIEIHHHHIDRIDALGGQISLMGRLIAPGEDAAVDAWVQRFHASAQDLRCSGVLRHLGDR